MTKAPSTPPASGSTAAAEVAQLLADELKFALLSRKKAAAASVERARRGDLVLSATDPEAVAQGSSLRLASLLEEQGAMADASKRARERRLPTIPRVWQAQAVELEEQASQLEAEAVTLLAKSDELRKALEDFDEWGYRPAAGFVDGQYWHTVPPGNGSFRLVDARGPKYQRLRTQAAGLLRQVDGLRTREPHQAGMVEADTVEELLTEVYSDPMRIGPPADAVIAWAEEVQEKERRRRSRFQPGDSSFVPVDTPLTLHLEWRNGAIDRAQSSVLLPELPQQVPDSVRETEAYRASEAERLRELNERRRAAGAQVIRQGSDGTSAPVTERSAFDTSATPDEIAREAAATGKSVAEVTADFAAAAMPRRP